MKKITDIEALLERYDDGATTHEEERELVRFFTEAEVPPHLEADKAYFLSLQELKETAVPEGLEARLSKMIDGRAAEEKKVIPPKKPARLVHWQWISGIAAGVALLFSISMYFNRPQEPDLVPADTCATPEEAYEQTRIALLQFSAALNKGVEGMTIIRETTDKVQERVNKQLNQLKQ